MYGCVGGRDATDAYGSSGRNVLGFLPDIIALGEPELIASVQPLLIQILQHNSQGALQVHWLAFFEGKNVV